jgi:hypothetical protein
MVSDLFELIDHLVGCGNIATVDGKDRGVASEFCGVT